MMYSLACDYSPAAGCPAFIKFITSALPAPEERALVQEYVG